jgi:hypothetical protein
MQLYQFEMLRGEDVISVEPAVPLYNTKAAWPKIIKMAKSVKLPGCRIRVREQSGDTIILVGGLPSSGLLPPNRTDHVPVRGSGRISC